jgi:mono/diheme cytochrome c family protein
MLLAGVLGSLVIALALAAAPADPADAGSTVLPPGNYRDLVLRTCAVCHPIDRVVAQRRSQEQWDQLIGVMVDRGAQASDEQQQQILQYLVQNFGRADPASSVAPASTP